MDVFSRLSSLARNLFREERLEQALNDEVRSYVELLAAEKVRSGMSAQEARRQAMIETGGTEQVKEQVRQARTGAFFESLLQDIRYGLRQLRRSPGFTAVAIITLALGIGANTAIFSVVDASLFRPLPYQGSEQLVNVTMRFRTGRRLVVAPHFAAWRNQSASLDGIGAFGIGFNGYGNGANLTGTGEPVRIDITPVTTGLFHLLGVKPIIGREFLSEEGAKGRSHVLLLGSSVWRQTFGGSPDVIGKPVSLDGDSYTIVGVMPAGLVYPPGDAWVPEVLDATNSSPASSDFPLLIVIGRLKPTTNIEQAQSELQVINDRLNGQFSPGRAHNFSQAKVEVIPLRALLAGDVRPLLFVLVGSVGLVLLIATANVANLLLARAAARSKEVAVRAALGAGRARLVRQLLAESVILAASSGALGLILGLWAVNAMKQLIPPSLPADVHLDLSILFFVAAISAASVLFFGSVPAFIASRPDLDEVLKGSGSRVRVGLGARQMRRFLVAGEIGLSLVLLIGAGLLLRSFWRLTETDPGFERDHVLLADCWMPVTEVSDSNRQEAFFSEVLDRLRGLPGVEFAGATTHYPMSIFNALSSGINIVGSPETALDEPISVASVSSDYFRALRIKLIKGRFFNGEDARRTRSVAIITESVARGAFQSRDALGVEISLDGPKGPWRTVVGVVADTRNYALDREPWPEVFLLYRQSPEFHMTFVIRTKGDPSRFAPAFRKMVAAVDANQPVSNIRTMDDIMDKAVAPHRFKMFLFGGFAGLSLLLAVAGLYGVVSYSVMQRTQEIGIRIALGAGRREVMRLILSEGIGLVLLGLAVGLACALAVTRYLATLLYEVKPTDATTYVAVSVILAAVALVASYIPARRAARVNPVTALRWE